MPRWTLSLGVSMLTVTTILGVIAVLIIVRDGGYSPREIIDPENVARMAQTYSALRYSAGANQPLAARVLLGFAYVGALLGGVAFALRLPWQVRLLACLPTVTVLAQSILMTSRTPSMYSFSLLAASYLAVSVLQRRDKSLTRGTVVGALAGVAVLWTLVFGVQLLREGSTIDRGQVQFGKSRAALFGSPAVFSHWLRDNGMSIDIRSATMGAGTFAGLYELLGIVPRMQGIWAETERLGGDEQKSNVHSAFRQLIEDFTLPGALFVICIWGILAGAAYRRLTDGALRWLPVLTCFYVFVICSYLSSVFTYNSTTFGLVIFSVLVSPRPLGLGMLAIERPRFRKPAGNAAAAAADRIQRGGSRVTV